MYRRNIIRFFFFFILFFSIFSISVIELIHDYYPFWFKEEFFMCAINEITLFSYLFITPPESLLLTTEKGILLNDELVTALSREKQKETFLYDFAIFLAKNFESLICILDKHNLFNSVYLIVDIIENEKLSKSDEIFLKNFPLFFLNHIESLVLIEEKSNSLNPDKICLSDNFGLIFSNCLENTVLMLEKGYLNVADVLNGGENVKTDFNKSLHLNSLERSSTRGDMGEGSLINLIKITLDRGGSSGNIFSGFTLILTLFFSIILFLFNIIFFVLDLDKIIYLLDYSEKIRISLISIIFFFDNFSIIKIILYVSSSFVFDLVFNSANSIIVMAVLVVNFFIHSLGFYVIDICFWWARTTTVLTSSGMSDSFRCLLPELFFLFFILLLFLYCFIKNSRRGVLGFKILNSEVIFFSKVLVLSTISLYINFAQVNYIVLNQLIVSDEGIYCLKILILFFFFFFLIALEEYMRWAEFYSYEFIILFLFIMFSFILAISSNNFLTLYILIEIYGLSIYSIIALKKDLYSIEASIKYYVYGSFSSIILLFSISLIYGFSGFINFYDLNLFFLKNDDISKFVFLGIILLAISFLLKIAAGPFYLWAIDVYSGCGLIVCFFLLLIPKIIFIFIFLKIFLKFFISFYYIWNWFFFVFILIGASIGIFGGVYQKTLKKIIIYSSFYNTSFLLIPFFILSEESLSAWFFFVVVYLLNILSIFFIVLSLKKLSSRGSYFNNIVDLFNFFKQRKLISIIFSINILSLAGLPPFSGFFSKFFYFYSIIGNIDGGGSTEHICFFLFLSVIGLVGFFYYLRLIKLVLFSSEKTSTIFVSNLDYFSSLIISFLSVLNLFFYYYTDTLWLISNYLSMLFFN